jgi:hypothetical protein
VDPYSDGLLLRLARSVYVSITCVVSSTLIGEKIVRLLAFQHEVECKTVSISLRNRTCSPQDVGIAIISMPALCAPMYPIFATYRYSVLR